MAEVFKNYATAGVGTSETTVYTAPANPTAVVIGMTCANVLSTTQVNINVKATVGGTAVYVVKNGGVAVGGAMVPIGGDQKVVLEAGDTLAVTSTSASSVDVLLSVLEQS